MNEFSPLSLIAAAEASPAATASTTAAPASTTTAPPPAPGFGDMLLPLAMIAVAFYFIILRPQNKERKAREEMIAKITKGDKVVSAGGIHGVVVDASDPNTLTVEVDKNRGVRLVFNRSAISLPPAPAPEKDKEKDSKKKDESDQPQVVVKK